MNKLILSIFILMTAAMLGTSAALAVSTIVVTPSNTQGWSTADTRPGGDVTYVNDSTAPGGQGALQMTTDATTTAKAQYMHEAGIALSDVNELSYYTKQNSGPTYAAASYQLPVYLNGGTSGFTTLVYEPYENGTVTNGDWQSWDVSSGQFWSSRSVTCSNGNVTAGAGGAPFYTLSDIKTMCPEAVVLGFGVNIGTNNPSYNVQTDLVNFNGMVYDFEALVGPPTNKDQCKNGGWMSFNNPTFRNQGQCVSSTNHR